MNGLNQYRTYQTETVGKEDHVAMLYAGARRFTDQALAALEEQRFEAVSLNVGKAQRILEELSGALNPEAGEVALNLMKLYDYWCWRLSQGLIKSDPTAFQEVSAALEEFHAVWSEAARLVRSQRSLRSLG